jgi:clan AA aspartic protease (TIGR02281 family)
MATIKFGIGQAITRREDDRLLTGQGRFVDDIRLPNALHAMFVRSPHAHARVGAIDTAEARAVEGVVAILTGSDLQADGVAPFPPNPMLKPDAGGSAAAVPLAALAADVVRFVGQPVAVVLAESRAAAERAANLVQVDYGVLPAVASPDAALAPSAPVQASPGVVYLTRDLRTGHFHVNALVNGTAVNFLVDTGASDVALSTDDALRLGLHPDKLVYNMPYQTANGVSMAARVTIDEIKVGDNVVRNVQASVGQGNMDMSLLGMTFLNRIGSIEVKGDRLVLRQ